MANTFFGLFKAQEQKVTYQNTISFLKILLQNLTGILSADSNKDGKLSTGEIFLAVQGIIVSVISSFSLIRSAIEELQTRPTPAQLNEITTSLANYFNIPDDLNKERMEVVIRAAIRFLGGLAELILAISAKGISEEKPVIPEFPTLVESPSLSRSVPESPNEEPEYVLRPLRLHYTDWSEKTETAPPVEDLDDLPVEDLDKLPSVEEVIEEATTKTEKKKGGKK